MFNIELYYLRISLQLNTTMRIHTYRDLSRYIQDFGIEGAFHTLAREQKETKEGYEPMFKHWLHLLRSGSSFDGLLKGWIPENERLQILAAKYDSGKSANALSTALLRTMVFTQKQKKLKDTLTKSVRTPFIYCFMVIFATFGLKHFLLPGIIKDDSVVQGWPQESISTYETIIFFTDNILLITLCTSLFIVFLYQYCLKGSSAIRDYLNVIPPFSYYQIITSGSFLLTLSSLMASKVTIYEAMELIENNSNNWASSHIALMRKRMSGEGVVSTDTITAQAFHSNMFDKYTASKLKSYSKTSNFKGILNELSDYILEVAQKRIEVLSERLNWILLFAVALVISKIGLMLMAASLGSLAKGV